MLFGTTSSVTIQDDDFSLTGKRSGGKQGGIAAGQRERFRFNAVFAETRAAISVASDANRKTRPENRSSFASSWHYDLKIISQHRLLTAMELLPQVLELPQPVTASGHVQRLVPVAELQQRGHMKLQEWDSRHGDEACSALCAL